MQKLKSQVKTKKKSGITGTLSQYYKYRYLFLMVQSYKNNF